MPVVYSLLSTLAVLFGTPCPDVESGPAIMWEDSSPDTRVFSTAISWEALEGSLPWRESEPNPPFPAREAMRLAEQEKFRLVSDIPRHGIFWYVDRVTLKPWYEDRWYWRISYKVHYDRDGLYGLTLVVLMDGTLVQPREYGVRDDELVSIDWRKKRYPPSLPAKEKVYSPLGNGRYFVTTISREMLQRSPPWRPNEANPPLSARKALAVAEREKARLIRPSADRDTVWSLEGISLVPRADDRWYWVIEYWGTPGGALGGSPSVLNVVVLMDGTLVQPKKTRDPWSRFINDGDRGPTDGESSVGEGCANEGDRKNQGSEDISQNHEWFDQPR